MARADAMDPLGQITAQHTHSHCQNRIRVRESRQWSSRVFEGLHMRVQAYDQPIKTGFLGCCTPIFSWLFPAPGQTREGCLTNSPCFWFDSTNAIICSLRYILSLLLFDLVHSKPSITHSIWEANIMKDGGVVRGCGQLYVGKIFLWHQQLFENFFGTRKKFQGWTWYSIFIETRSCIHIYKSEPKVIETMMAHHNFLNFFT